MIDEIHSSDEELADADTSFKELKDSIDECISKLNKLSNADNGSLEALEK